MRRIREQVARAEGRPIEQLETPPATLMFATSTYGREKLLQGRGAGKQLKKKEKPDLSEGHQTDRTARRLAGPRSNAGPERTTSSGSLH